MKPSRSPLVVGACRFATLALLITLHALPLTLPACGGDEGGNGGGTSGASREELTQRWIEANNRMQAKHCTVAAFCHPNTFAAQKGNESVESCIEYSEWIVSTTVHVFQTGDKRVEDCALLAVPTQESCAAALERTTDSELCAIMNGETLRMDFHRIPECAPLVAADIECLSFVPAAPGRPGGDL